MTTLVIVMAIIIIFLLFMMLALFVTSKKTIQELRWSIESNKIQETIAMRQIKETLREYGVDSRIIRKAFEFEKKK